VLAVQEHALRGGLSVGIVIPAFIKKIRRATLSALSAK
jgi:hypothetical protein